MNQKKIKTYPFNKPKKPEANARLRGFKIFVIFVQIRPPPPHRAASGGPDKPGHDEQGVNQGLQPLVPAARETPLAPSTLLIDRRLTPSTLRSLSY